VVNQLPLGVKQFFITDDRIHMINVPSLFMDKIGNSRFPARSMLYVRPDRWVVFSRSGESEAGCGFSKTPFPPCFAIVNNIGPVCTLCPGITEAHWRQVKSKWGVA